MVKIRLHGTLKECNEAVEKLKEAFYVLDITRFYKQKGMSSEVCVCMDVEVKQEEILKELIKVQENQDLKKSKQELKEMLDSMAYDEQSRKSFIKDLGKRISKERNEKQLSVKEFSLLCGVSEACLYNAEKGVDVRTTTLIAICLALDMTLDDFIPPELYNSHYKS